MAAPRVPRSAPARSAGDRGRAGARPRRTRRRSSRRCGGGAATVGAGSPARPRRRRDAPGRGAGRGAAGLRRPARRRARPDGEPTPAAAAARPRDRRRRPARAGVGRGARASARARAARRRPRGPSRGARRCASRAGATSSWKRPDSRCSSSSTTRVEAAALLVDLDDVAGRDALGVWRRGRGGAARSGEERRLGHIGMLRAPTSRALTTGARRPHPSTRRCRATFSVRSVRTCSDRRAAAPRASAARVAASSTGS